MSSSVSLVRQLWRDLPTSQACTLIRRVHLARGFATATPPTVPQRAEPQRSVPQRAVQPVTPKGNKKIQQMNLCRIVIPPLPPGESTFLTVHADHRPTVGTGMSRYLRDVRNFFPATIGTPFANDRINIAIERNYFERIVKHFGGDLKFRTRVLSLVVNNIEGATQTHTVICKDIYRHTVTDAPLSVSFMLFVPNRPFNFALPVEYVNIDECIGVAKDSEILPLRPSLECVWNGDVLMPLAVEIDMTHADVGRVIRTSEAAAAAAAASITALKFRYRGGVDRVITVVTGLGGTGADDVDDEVEAALATAAAAKATTTKAAASKTAAAGTTAAGKKGDDIPPPAPEKGKKK